MDSETHEKYMQKIRQFLTQAEQDAQLQRAEWLKEITSLPIDDETMKMIDDLMENMNKAQGAQKTPDPYAHMENVVSSNLSNTCSCLYPRK